MEEYLTTDELSKRIKMAPGTIRNMIWQEKLKIGVHYLKPTPRKLLFIWSEVEAWLHQKTTSKHEYPRQNSESLINI